VCPAPTVPPATNRRPGGLSRDELSDGDRVWRAPSAPNKKEHSGRTFTGQPVARLGAVGRSASAMTRRYRIPH
jgi:hypothetical protein